MTSLPPMSERGDDQRDILVSAEVSERASRDWFVEYMADCRSLVIRELETLVARRGGEGKQLYELMLDYPLRAAKAIRPTICIAVCRALGGSLHGVLGSAMVLELYHNAFLIHDDVEDGSEKRRDRATLHRSHGLPQAVNVGDAMLALALEPLLDNTRLLSVGKALRILQEISRMARESAEGQASELAWIKARDLLPSERDYLRMIYKKTTVYSFVTPAVLGAIVAGASATQLSQLRRFSVAIGTAFQIQDDILNLVGDERDYGKEIDGDLWEGKYTLILIHALRSASESERRHAQEILARPRPRSVDGEPLLPLLDELTASGELTPAARLRLELALSHERRTLHAKSAADVAFLRDLIERAGSLTYARNAAEKRARRARRTLAEMASWLSPSIHRDVLFGLTDFVLTRQR
jgi:geranylgeranyl diphosphate synthase type II